jgi:hypothetical protein
LTITAVAVPTKTLSTVLYTGVGITLLIAQAQACFYCHALYLHHISRKITPTQPFWVAFIGKTPNQAANFRSLARCAPLVSIDLWGFGYGSLFIPNESLLGIPYTHITSDNPDKTVRWRYARIPCIAFDNSPVPVPALETPTPHKAEATTA